MPRRARNARRTSPRRPTRAPLVGGRYRLAEEIGRGGMATVHRASDTQLEREVAMKLMRAELGEDRLFVERFVNEARNAASVVHPNVVTVHDFGTDGPAPYIVMELVDGGELSRLIATDGALAPQRAAAIAAEVASALHAAHARGIVHRDVKPGNILLSRDGHVRVADFGIARATGEQSLTRTGTSLGSVEYFSPEQARGEPATAASDIYALGVVLYEMLTGRRPFDGDTPYATAVARLEAAPPDPRSVAPEVPKALAAIATRAMALRPKDRFRSAGDMTRRLESWLASNPRASSAPVGQPAAAAVAAATASREAGGRARAEPQRSAAATQARPLPVAPGAPWRVRRLALTGALVLLLALIGFTGGRLFAGVNDGVFAPDVLIGEPRGGVLESNREPEPTFAETFTLDPETLMVSEHRRTAQPAMEPVTSATPEPVAALPAAALPAAALPAAIPPHAQARTPARAPVMVAMAEPPEQSVVAFYSYVEDGSFDAAYALWTERMKANFPRQTNLDGRWADTADVTITRMYVAEQTPTTAKVQIYFVETKDNGSSRQFVGWWDLVGTPSGWLLDWPNF